MRKEDGTIYNAGRDDFNEARNANILKKFVYLCLKTNGILNVNVADKKR